MSKKKLIYIVAYNAQSHIFKVLQDVPYNLLGNYEVLVSDDFSQDKTSEVVAKYQQENPDKNVKLVTQKKNLGYGGNQKFGYQYAIDNDFDLVVLVHGDGQYSPKLAPQAIDQIVKDGFDVVLGSRMINKRSALQGGMPLYKFLGNIILTKLQNFILRQNLTEYHTGFRAYKTKALSQINFLYNNDGFSFDTDILIQLINRKARIKEISIPTHYGDEVCRVNGLRYAFEIILSSAISRLQKVGICKVKKFE